VPAVWGLVAAAKEERLPHDVGHVTGAARDSKVPCDGLPLLRIRRHTDSALVKVSAIAAAYASTSFGSDGCPE
jgi:hypothetical protein